MAKRAKASESSEPEREVGLVTVDHPSPSSDLPQVEAKPALPPPPPPVPPEAPPRTPAGPSFGDRVGRFFRFLLRLVLLLILLGLLSIALYLALPWFYDRFIRPVERTAAQVQQLQSMQARTEQQLADLQTKLETLENVQNEQDGALTEMEQRLSDVETEITARTESLAALERLQSELEEQNQVISSELKRQIELLKAMELLSRARLSLYQSNFGLAREDVQIARDILAGIEPNASEADGENLGAVIFRLDMTLSNLPDFPVAASDDLDIAWQILLTGLPEGTPNAPTTPTPSTANMTVTSTPDAADMTTTPTPRGTLQPSATP
jgi:signal transduction histidine kinase